MEFAPYLADTEVSLRKGARTVRTSGQAAPLREWRFVAPGAQRRPRTESQHGSASRGIGLLSRPRVAWAALAIMTVIFASILVLRG